MPVKPIPDGYHAVTPYLIVEDVAALIQFMKQCFEGEEIRRMKRPDDSIMHAEVRISDSGVMMGEATAAYKPMPAMLHLYLEDTDAVYERVLQAGALSLRAPTDEPYGDRMAGVQERWGNQWLIATHLEDVVQAA
ncbi:MAG TPA: VOC family protein [Rhodothermales bacterium]|nr:VOC family protein [Rhodothermales bacterium]